MGERLEKSAAFDNQREPCAFRYHSECSDRIVYRCHVHASGRLCVIRTVVEGFSLKWAIHIPVKVGDYIREEVSIGRNG